jgi:hypothetical protein
MIIPSNMGDISAMVATVMSVLDHVKQPDASENP